MALRMKITKTSTFVEIYDDENKDYKLQYHFDKEINRDVTSPALAMMEEIVRESIANAPLKPDTEAVVEPQSRKKSGMFG